MDEDNIEIFVYKWTPDSDKSKACIQISHGLVEHAGRYERVAESLTSAGYICYADDHRGHGKTGGIKNKGYLGDDGWNKVVNDLKMLNDIIVEENSGIPCFLIGHSWGSLLFQDYVQRWGEGVKGLILSGSSGKSDRRRMREEIDTSKKVLGGSNSLNTDEKTLSRRFGDLNKQFDPEKTGTGFEWLSRDKDEVIKYVEDPFCGFAVTKNLSDQLSIGVSKIWREENERRIPKDLPILIMSGSDDPVANRGKNLHILMERYKKYGINDVSIKIYEGARHEIFNETNREEVYRDLIQWLGDHL